MKNIRFALITAVLFVLCSTCTVTAETTAYVANSGADEMLLVTTGNEAVDTTPLTGTPYGVAVTPDGNQVLVTQEEADALVFIDTSDFSGTPFTLSVGKSPRGVAVDPTGQYAYVANFNDDTVSRINVTRRSIVDTITVGDGPWGVAVHYDEQNDAPVVYVTDHRDDSVTVINEDNQTTAIDVGDGPIGLAVTPDGGSVYIANSNDDTVSIIDTHTDTVIDTVTVDSSPWGIAVGADGDYVYVTNSGADTVTVIQTATHSIAGTYIVGDTPRGVSAPGNGTFAYVVNQGEGQSNGSISKIDMDEETVTEFAVGLIDEAYSIGAFIGDTPPSPPSGLEAVSDHETIVDLSWTDNSTGERGFKIERSRDDETNYTQIASIAENSTTYEDVGLSSDTVYFYRIRAYIEAADSEYSTSADTTTLRYSGSIWCFIDTMIK